MPGNSRFPDRRLAPLWLVWCCLTLPAQIQKVDPGKTITFEVPGATAAYSLDESLADAFAINGTVAVTGTKPGTTHVVVVTPSGTRTFEVLVTTPPPNYPPGFVLPSQADRAEGGYSEQRYYSSPAEIQNQVDFSEIQGGYRTHAHLVDTTLVGPLDPGQSRLALSSATYEFATPARDVTLLDQYVDESQLTINGSIIRGFHMVEDNWFVHAGYTSEATFEGLFLPLQPELVLGGGYRRPLTENSSVTASFYYLQGPAVGLTGRSGGVGDLQYKYRPREDFWFTTDLGIGDGVGGAAQLYYRTGRDNIVALARFTPPPFASLAANSFRGLHSDIAWTRHINPKFDLAFTFFNDNLVLPDIRESALSGAANLRYQLTRHWALTGGAIASSLTTTPPPSPAIRSFTLPAGLAFQARHFGAGGLYQFAATPGRDTGGKQIRASAHSGWGAFSFNAYAERDTNAPTLSFIFGQVTGLQQALDQLGLQATTVQQVDELLSSNAYLIAAGYIKGATINLVPVRTQIGGAANWSNHGRHRTQLSYTYLYNDNRMLLGSSQDSAHTLDVSHIVSSADDLSLACSVLSIRNPGGSSQFAPVCFAAWRHQFDRVPPFLVRERRGTIAGSAFRDDHSKGVLELGMPPVPDVEVMLDDGRSMRTRPDGSFRFAGVPLGKHRVVAVYRSTMPFFFTTPSALDVDVDDVDVDEDAAVNFGIGYALSGLIVEVLNDGGQGIGGVSLSIRNEASPWKGATGADGAVFVPSLVAGRYDVQIDPDTLPPGYSTEGLDHPQAVTVAASSPGRAVFTARALRSISGRVMSYDTRAGRYVPVAGTKLVLKEAGLTTITDALGRYLFRDLAAGSYTVSVPSEAPTPAHTVLLGTLPVDLANVDFHINRSPPKP